MRSKPSCSAAHRWAPTALPRRRKPEQCHLLSNSTAPAIPCRSPATPTSVHFAGRGAFPEDPACVHGKAWHGAARRPFPYRLPWSSPCPRFTPTFSPGTPPATSATPSSRPWSRRPPAALHSPPDPVLWRLTGLLWNCTDILPLEYCHISTCHKGRRTRRRPEPSGRSSPPSPTDTGDRPDPIPFTPRPATQRVSRNGSCTSVSDSGADLSRRGARLR